MERALLLINYPELVPLNKKCTKYEGYITISPSSTFRIKLHAPKFPSIQNLEYVIPSVQGTNYEQKIHEYVTTSSNIIEFLERVQSVLIEYTNNKKKEQNDVDLSILEQYQQLYKHPAIKRIQVNKTFTKFKIKLEDSSARHHYVAISVQNNLFFISEHYLPNISQKHDLFQKTPNLLELFELYLQNIENLQSYFDTMDSIDAVCWVIDPQRPTRRDYTRRIMIGHNISIQITFDPWNIFTRPQIQFLGSETAVEPFRKSFVENLENWDPQYDIVQSILRLLDLPFFPMAPNETTNITNDLDFALNECCICFCVRLNDKLPEQICENRSCEQHFHTDCLYQWLISIASVHNNFQLIQGECPNCKTLISCPIPESV